MSAGPSNWDAAWVFVKYKVQGQNWQHATLSTNASHYSFNTSLSIPSAMTFYPASDGKGVFIYRSADGTGNIDLKDVLLRWNYGTDGVSDGANLQIQVFAIEMVYIPTGPFFIGDGNISTPPSTKGFTINNQGNNLPYLVTSENAITFISSSSTSTTSVYNPAYTSGYTLPASFPKGYEAFYIMKYEISQKQYVDFFNTLPNDATRSNRNLGCNSSSTSETNRNNFYWSGQVNDDAILTNGKSGDRACNYLHFADGCAFADWAALRPITELEFEKASRGCDLTNPGNPVPIFPVNGEYAWGSTAINNVGSLVNDGTANEGLPSPLTNQANAQYSGTSISGPLRNGIFAAKGWTTDQRKQSGASYYGVMELSGNLAEWVKPTYACNSGSYNFTGNNGDGVLSANSNANQSYWNGSYSEVALSNDWYFALKGGGYASPSSELRTSDRSSSMFSTSCYSGSGRSSDRGFRCGRRP